MTASEDQNIALYDSAQRQDSEHAVTCQPETQLKILQDIRSWADSRSSAHICWLRGPAGTGKTTVAHTIADEYDQLAATCFWRQTGDRDDIKRLRDLIGQGRHKKIPSAGKAMEKTLNLNDAPPPRDPLSPSLENQLSTFLIANLKPSAPNLVVIDGLDECSSQDGICKLIELICKLKSSPFRFLLTSRPEPGIEASFSYHGHTTALIPSLETTFEGRPSESDLEKLVEQSEGL
jgi:hypothetical protein